MCAENISCVDLRAISSMFDRAVQKRHSIPASPAILPLNMLLLSLFLCIFFKYSIFSEKKSILNLADFDHIFPKSLVALHGRLETPVPNKF